MPELALDRLDVVVRGSFNPAILSPAWLFGQGLIGAADFERAEVDLITRDLAVFRTAWLACHATPDTLQFWTEDSVEFERVRDVAVGTLRALPHTPVSALGINRSVHFPIRTLEKWHAIGDAVVPKEPWEGVLQAPGTRSVTLWGVRPDDYTGRVQVQFEPSFRVAQAIFLSINDHYQLGRAARDSVPSTRDAAWQQTYEEDARLDAAKFDVALEVLLENWSTSVAQSKEIVERVATRLDAA